MEAKSIKLTHPITSWNDEKISELVPKRELNLGDAEAIEGLGNTAKLIALVSRLCELPESAAREIHKDDIETVDRGIAPFCEPVKKSRKTGGSS